MPVTRGIWSKKNGDVIYHNAPSYVADHFKGRTRILGDLNEGNCSLEIDDIKPFDNGPFCFHAERGNDRVRYNNSCVFVVMKASPAKPVMTSVTPEVDADSTVTVSCSVTHTCPSHPPTFSWSVPSLTNEITQTWTPEGIWEMTSTITFRAAGGDEVKSLTCTAKSWLGKTQASTVQLTVKGSSIHPAAIAVSVQIVVILAAVFGVVLCKRRGSIWNRISRRAEDGRSGWKGDSETRRSFWGRFSRGQGNAADLNVGYVNNTTTVN
ncbi:hypothetical protein ABVT39_000945 [Epinephelus coioides]